MKREQAYTLLKKYTTKPNLLKHGLAVEAVMRHFAQMQGEDIEYWGVVGLLHDIDYELGEKEHCHACVKILKEEGISDEIIKSIQSHGYELCTDIKPEHNMEKVLITIDQITGFIIACALMKPNKTLAEVTLKSMKKKWKDKGFARGTERARIEKWTADMGKDMDFMLEESLKGMLVIHAELGL